MCDVECVLSQSALYAILPSNLLFLKHQLGKHRRRFDLNSRNPI
jgi:hypothetical protein